MIRRWRQAMRKVDTGLLWGGIWLAALAVPFVTPRWLAGFSGLAWLSALALAPGRHHGRRLMGLAAGFLAAWSVLLLLVHLAYPSSLRPILNLSAWLALGLNLLLAKTPLDLALTLARRLAPVLGRPRSQKLALALALVARLIPGLLASALEIRTSLNRRAAGLPLTTRLSLWGRTLIRDSLAQTDELARSLSKRWPW